MRAGRLFTAVLILIVTVAAAAVSAQTARQLSILQAEARRAHTTRDLAVLRGGAGSADVDTALLAVRALGRLERPVLIPDLLLLLRSRLPEVRAEAANALGQAAEGWGAGAPAVTLGRVATALMARLDADDDVNVRAAASETLGRLPYGTAAEVGRAEAALAKAAGEDGTVASLLGVAKGLEALVRLHRERKPPSPETLALLAGLAAPEPGADTAPRIRRLALDALATAGATDDRIVARAAVDPDEQVRRLAMRATSNQGISEGGAAGVLARGLGDPVAMVRIEALRALNIRRRGDAAVCATNVDLAADPVVAVALEAIDQLEACGQWPDAVALLDLTAASLSSGASRSWHGPAHALLAAAAAAPRSAGAHLPAFVESPAWPVRRYAARAAGRLREAAVLEGLALDPNDNVREAAIEQLRIVSGHDADALFVESLSRPGYQAVRAAAYALSGSPSPALAVPALEAAAAGFADAGDNASSVRDAIRAALVSLEATPDPMKAPSGGVPAPTLENWRRLVSARARITMRDGGAFDLALLADQAPQTVIRFAELASAGYYDGLTFHRVEPNFVVQAGSPGASEYVGDRQFMNDEVGRWPHTRGAVGLSTRGRDTGDAQFFVDLVDNPRLDHEYTVFAHVLDGMQVVDAIVEGDAIARIEILGAP
jgi:cyclophilin family peptidyl-prolyl cis-trans isomerase